MGAKWNRSMWGKMKFINGGKVEWSIFIGVYILYFRIMVRKYNRKTTQQSWSEESMKRAIEEVLGGSLTVKSAAAEYNVPKSTLFRRAKKGNEENASTAAKKGLGRFRTVFNVQQEGEILEYILLMEKRLFGLSQMDLRSLAYQFAVRNGIPNNFDQKSGLAGRDWIQGFLKRHPRLSMRLPEKTSAARASAFNRPNVTKFFELLGELMDRYKFSASHIYNCDETGISTVPNKPGKIISLKGKKQVGILSSAERGTLITVEICYNAAGFYIPPLLIFPRVRRNPLFEKGLPPESLVECHPTGWMQSHIFAPTWFNHFLKYSKPTKEEPVLLILDGHSTHTKNLELVQMSKENNVHILVIPPHTSHRMQPLDVSFMFPLSSYYGQECKNWLRNNPGKVVTIHDSGELFGRAYQRAATIQNALSGFKNTGICPYNPGVFPDDLFEPAETTNRKSNNGNGEEEDAPENESNTPPDPIERTPSPGTVENIPPQPNDANSSPLPGCSYKQQQSQQLYFSPQDIMPIPKADTQRPKRNYKRGKTMILTSTPNVEELKEHNRVCQSRKPKNLATRKLFSAAKKGKKLKVIQESSSDSSLQESKDLCDDSLSSWNEDDVDEISKPLHQSLAVEQVNVEDIKDGDFLKVKLADVKSKSTKIFVAKVQQIEDTTVTVSFMRQYRQNFDTYVFPEIPDESEIFFSEVVGRLLNPKMLRHGQIKFDIK
ncbi:uncharacterized protein LOC116176797 isoform X1 [Photinus pyralis]|uniref:HTH CENPB-type domain-containing protein n=2 Tax=Photinus pyralis TaxID=7054 RepID=A0A1Y1NBL1_PHOPY|nr:uncharacterized protein LOC116163328 isoform X1 [Photinus pyralis]XP_031351407.1 uncharacterized protein LOC116176790 isoform X1 [Photinus pyralis]XP_031351418.1 uncharacterized protein LOC116176797 isoform X1 [Photinus pyralis]